MFSHLIQHIPHKHTPRTLWMWRSNRVLKNSKHNEQKLIVACSKWNFFISFITQLISHAYSCLFSSKCNNLPFGNMSEILNGIAYWGGSTVWGNWTWQSWDAQNSTGDMTRQTSDRKNERESLEQCPEVWVWVNNWKCNGFISYGVMCEE